MCWFLSAPNCCPFIFNPTAEARGLICNQEAGGGTPLDTLKTCPAIHTLHRGSKFPQPSNSSTSSLPSVQTSEAVGSISTSNHTRQSLYRLVTDLDGFWGMHIPNYTHINQKTTCGNWLSPSTMWVPMLPAWAVSTFACWDILLDPFVQRDRILLCSQVKSPFYPNNIFCFFKKIFFQFPPLQVASITKWPEIHLDSPQPISSHTLQSY